MRSLRKRNNSEGSNSSCASTSSNKRPLEDPETLEISDKKRVKSTKEQKSKQKSKVEKKTIMQEQMTLMQEQLTTLLAQMQTVVSNTTVTNEQLTKLSGEVDAVKTVQTATTKKVAKLNKEITALKNNVASLETENNMLHQKSLSREIVIFGFYSLKKETMGTLVDSLGEALELQLNLNDFVHIYPVQHKDKARCTIYGELYSQQKKDMLIKKCRAKKPLVIEDVMNLNPNDPRRGTEIAIRSKLTTRNRLILNEARKHKDNFKFAWENEGRILIRQDEKSPIMEIHSMDQLMQLLTTNMSIASTEDEEID
jgi:hypothetical protein